MERGPLQSFPFFCFYMRFDAIHNLLDRVQSIDESTAWRFAMDENAQRFIVSMNTHEQLGEDGVDANGLSLGEYAPFTIDFRTSKGLQVSHIDFHVTGDYWRSWKVEVLDDEIVIHVDEERFNELVHDLNFSPEHVGLTDINTDRLAELIRKNYLEYAKSAIFL